MHRWSLRAQPRVVFVRIGWMRRYDLSRERNGPIRGGSYNVDDIGSEANNFSAIQGRLYGFAQVSRRLGGFNLVRLGSASSKGSVDGVIVAMFATEDVGGQCLVGWYRDATCHAESYDRRGKYGGFNFEAEMDSAVLLPLAERTLTPPDRLNGGFGQANVRYAYSQAGELELHPWMRETIDWIHRYSGPNMLKGAEAGEPPHEASSRGRHRRLSAEQNRAVENRSMRVAKKYFTVRGYDVEDVHRNHSYDLVCTKGKESFRVEVKGTTDDPISVEVTKNEVRSARDASHQTVLFVVSNIELRESDGRWRGHGGVAHWIRDWRPRDQNLEPISYRYELPKNLPLAR